MDKERGGIYLKGNVTEQGEEKGKEGKEQESGEKCRKGMKWERKGVNGFH